jgi:hypothetical protein
MAVSIDTVYQKVLALANKEQRGYITPQEFNLFANQAQQEIFEQYFYDLNQASKNTGNNTFHSDVDDLLEQKMQIFEKMDKTTVISTYAHATGYHSNIKVLPSYIYRVTKIERQNAGGPYRDCEILSTKDFNNCMNHSYLTAPSAARPIANIRNNHMRVLTGPDTFVVPSRVFYFKKPEIVEWGYFIINNKALHDTSTTKTTNFELHPSEESELVYKILKLAGISIKRNDITMGGQTLETLQVQQEKQ